MATQTESTVDYLYPDNAYARARMLLADSKSAADHPFFIDTATALVARLLHAAALGTRGFSEVITWAGDLDASSGTVMELLATSNTASHWAWHHDVWRQGPATTIDATAKLAGAALSR